MKNLQIFLLATFILLLIVNIIQINNDIERKNAECTYWKERTVIEEIELNAILKSFVLKDSLMINQMNNK